MSALIPLFGLGLQGKSPNVTAQRRVNLYPEIQFEADKCRVAYYQTPGSESFVFLGASPVRGMHTAAVSSYLYAVQHDTLYQVDAAAGSTSLGTLGTSSGRVCMSDDGTRILIVDGVGGYYWNIQTSTFTTIADADFPAGATTCAFLAQRQIAEVPGTGSFAWSDLSASTWPSANTATAEASPDKLVRVYALNGNLLLFGETTLEFWGVTSDANQPYGWINGAATQWGLAAKWSVANIAESCAFLARNAQGQVQVAILRGYQVVPISTPELDYEINSYTAIEDADAFSNLNGGHPQYTISFPTAGKTWMYDLQSQSWQELQSPTGGIYRGAMGTNFRNKTHIADRDEGRILALNPYIYTDNGENVECQIVGKHVSRGDPLSVSELWVDVEMGVGEPADNPMLRLRTSKDGGHVWSNELWRQIGPQGVYQRRAVFRRLGRARDWNFELSASGNWKKVFIGAYMESA